MNPHVTEKTCGPVGITFRVWDDGSVRLDVEFINTERKLAELFMLDMKATEAAATAITCAVTSSESETTPLSFEVSEHFSVEEDAVLRVHDANGEDGLRYKLVEYPPDRGRWGLVRSYVFDSEKKVGPCLMEGRLRNLVLAKRLAGAMARHWRKQERTEDA